MIKSIFIIFTSLMVFSCASNKYYLHENDTIKLTVEPIEWFLTFPEGDFVLQQENIKPDKSSAYFMFSSAKIGIVVSFFIEPISNCKTAECCRDRAWLKHKMALRGATDIKLSSIGEAYTYEYLLPEVLNQKNINVHLYKDGYWIDVHLSKVFYESRDYQLFTDFINTLSFSTKVKQIDTQK